MKKFATASAAIAVFASIMAGILWQQLRAERARMHALQSRITQLELAHAKFSATALPEVATPQTTASVAAPLPASEPVPAASSGTPTTGKRTASSTVSINSRELLNDPDYRAGMAASLRQAMMQLYPDLAKELDIPAEQASKLMDILANNGVALSGLVLGDPEGGENNAPAATRALADAQRKQDADIRALLGDAKTQQWKEYQESMPARQLVSRVRTTLESSGNNLSPLQQKQLIATMTAEQKRRNTEMSQALQTRSASPTSPRDAASILEQQLQSTEESNRRVQDAASTYLNQQQLDALRTQQNMELAVTRAMLRAQRTGAANGQSPADPVVIIGGPTGRP